MNRDLFAAAGGVVDATTDPYFNSTTLLLSGDGTNGAQNNTFVDSSVNNATITRANTPTQGSFSPFSQTGWSGYFNGSSSNLQIASNAALAVGAGDFTIEMWVYSTSTTNRLISYGIANSPILYINGSNFVQYDNYGTAVLQTSSIAVPLNAWSHVALVRLASTSKIYINGVQASTSGVGADSTNYVQSGVYIGVDVATTFMTGYLSNLRVVKGVAVYTGAFTPPTAPLSRTQSAGTNILALSGTETNLLTLQDNRFKDNSTNNFTITAVGTPSVQAFSPFAPIAAYSLPTAAAGSAYFNGSSYISVPDSTAFTMGSGDFTLEAWVYLTTSGTSRMIFGTCDAAGSQGSMSYVLSINASNNAFFAVGYGGSMYGSTNTATVPTNQWVHIAGVRSGANVYVYLNGMQSTSNTNMGALAITDSTQVVAIGRNGAGNFEYLTGYISNARITKGTAVYTGNFTPLGTPLSKIQSAGTNIAALSGTETSLLTLQDSTFKDNSVNVVTITASATPPVIQSFTPFTQVWGGYFDGSGYSTLTMSNTTSLAMGTGNFTIEFWINTSNIVQTGYVLQTDTGANTLYVSISGSTIRLTNQSTVFAVTPTLLSNTWYHIAVVRSGTSSVIYTNGVAGTAVSCSIDFTQNGLTIGGNSFIGYLSDCRIVKGIAVYTGAFTPPAKTLSATQAAGTNISAIYPGQTSLLTLQDPTFKDNATLPNTITAVGTPKAQLVSAPFTSAATVDPVNGSAYFNGSTDYLSVPDNAAFEFGAGDFTLEGWFNFSSLPSTNGYQATLFAKWATGQPSYELYLYNSSGTYALYFTYSTNGSTAINIGPISFTPSLGVWYHIALCKNSTNLIFYVNGSQQGATQTLSAALFDSTAPMLVGSFSTTANCYFNGYASNARIVKGTAVYTAAFTPPSAPLTAITNTSLLTLQDTTFKDNSTNAAVITASGTPAMRAFTPFASNWGGYFASGEMLSIASSSATTFATGDFTIEFWVNAAAWASGDYNRLARIGDIQIGVYSYSGQYLTYYNGTGFVIGSGILPATNKWHHIAVCRSSGTSKLYLNGVQVGSSFVDSANFGAGSIDINNNTPYPTQAYISNFRIVKGTAVYTTNFTPPSAPLTAITNTSLLTLQNNAFIDNSTNALAITVVGAPKTQLLQLPFTSSITKVPAPWNISVTAPLATVGGSMYFDSSSCLSVPPTSNFAFGTGNFTFECYIYGNSTTFGSGAICAPNAYNGATTFWAMLVGGGNVTWQYSHGNANLFSVSAVAYYNTWLHVAVVRSSNTTGNTTKMYFNGVQVGTGAENENYASTTTYLIARNGDGSYNMGAGYISNLRIVKGTAVYTGNFTPPTAPPQPTQTPGLLGSNVNAIDGTNTSLLLLGSNAGIYDATAKNDIITVGNAQVSSTQIKYGTGAMYFDGTGDYLNIPTTTQFNPSKPFTVEFWTYPNSITAVAWINGNSGLFYIETFGGTLYVGDGTNNIITATPPSTGTWTHVALSFDGTTNRLFYNGVSQGTSTSVLLSNVLTSWYIGSKFDGTRPFNGYIDDLRITKGVARYTIPFTPPTKAMIGQ